MYIYIYIYIYSGTGSAWHALTPLLVARRWATGFDCRARALDSLPFRSLQRAFRKAPGAHVGCEATAEGTLPCRDGFCGIHCWRLVFFRARVVRQENPCKEIGTLRSLDQQGIRWGQNVAYASFFHSYVSDLRKLISIREFTAWGAPPPVGGVLYPPHLCPVILLSGIRRGTSPPKLPSNGAREDPRACRDGLAARIVSLASASDVYIYIYI